MKKIMNVVSPMVALSCLALTGYLAVNKRKNMLDVIIEEIETMK